MTTEITDDSVETPNSKHQASGKFQISSFNRTFGSTRLGFQWKVDLGVWRFLDWLPLVVLTGLALIARDRVPAWLFTWVMAGGIFWGCKWVTWRRAWRMGPEQGIGRSIAYFFLWPGMDAKEFLRKENRKYQSGRALLLWIKPTLRICFGVGLLEIASRGADWNPLMAGWVGMLGIVMVLHFGIFELLAIGWQWMGINAQQVMREPLKAASLAEFWSRRWNTAFNNLAQELAFRPLARRFGVTGAMLGVFLISGLVHELVISLPARGGYGLPTAYFLLQGDGVLLERSGWGRGLGLGRGLRGRLFALAFAAGPVFWLFHPLFIHHVIVPMLRFIGQLKGLS